MGKPTVNFPVYFLFLLDNSGSMSGSNIDELNNGMATVINELRKHGKLNSMFPIRLGTIHFETEVGWHIPFTDIFSCSWIPLQATGGTNMTEAIRLASQALNTQIGSLGVPPIIVLVSDGKPDDESSVRVELENFLNTPWGKLAIRRSIAIGSGCNRNVMSMFTGSAEFVYDIKDAKAQLAKFIKDLAIALIAEPLYSGRIR